MENQSVSLYGAYWCPDCRRSKQFLGEQQIAYEWIDIEQDADAEQFVIEKNNGKRIIPTIVFEDGSFLVEPSNAELAQKLGLKTTAQYDFYETVIVGGGPAGLTAAIYLAREGIKTLVIERSALGGQAAITEKLDNLPGFPEGIAGREFGQRLRRQAERFGVELLQAQEVERVFQRDNYHVVQTSDGSEYCGCALLIATGSRYRRLGVPGEEDYIGAGVHFCATCDGPFYKGKHVAVVGGGNSAAEESLQLTKFADRVTIFVRGGSFKASSVVQESVLGDPKIDVIWNTEVEAFEGSDSKLKRVKLCQNETGEASEMEVDGAFIFIGLDPNVSFLRETSVRLSQYGFIITGHDLMHEGSLHNGRPPAFTERDPLPLETNVPGLFAAGDVRLGSTKQVASSTGEGATAALLIREYLKTV